jgi:hypothetical protein
MCCRQSLGNLAMTRCRVCNRDCAGSVAYICEGLIAVGCYDYWDGDLRLHNKEVSAHMHDTEYLLASKHRRQG